MLNVVITTIQPPTACMLRLGQFLVIHDAKLVVAGDAKGPAAYDMSSVNDLDAGQIEFLDLDKQTSGSFSLARSLPTHHYCRKNIGYLQAIHSGATSIYETDDDNAPLDRWAVRQEWIDSPRFVDADSSDTPSWINVYKYFSAGLVWPRGLPLDEIREGSRPASEPDASLSGLADDRGRYWAPIQQGLADGAPDVDAVWRLVLDSDFVFDGGKSVMLSPGQWCPFNTQSTWWWPTVFPLLYVPSYCSFRMCDIWKSFVAQRCLWELGTGVVFHASEVKQDRNPHNLMRDFEDEIPGYLQNHQLVAKLESVNLASGSENVAGNLRSCYQALIAEGFFPEKELELVDAWLADVKAATCQSV